MFFKKLFHHKYDEPKTQSKNNRIVDYFCVISSVEIGDMPEPPFSQGKYGAEEEYKKLLDTMQPLFAEYKENGKIDTTYPIQGSQADFDMYNLKHKCVSLFIDSPINTIKTKDNHYVVASDGRHRMYAAKKYGFSILIHVAEEEL